MHGLKIDWIKHEVVLEGDKKEIVEKLVEQYEYLFGQASVEVCKDAVKDIISQLPQNQMPPILS